MAATQTQDLLQAAELLAQGQLVAIPTETVYGLAANALDPKAVSHIFSVKERPAFDPLIVHLAQGEDMAQYVAALPPAFERLYRYFGAGPLTYILPKKALVPDIVTAGHSTVGIRIPRHPLTQQLLSKLPFPLAAPSANLFGRLSPTSADHVADQLGERIPLILDGGHCAVGVESTIVDLSGKQARVLRLGGLSLEVLTKALGHKPAVNAHSASNPRAPGMLSAHYSPGKPVELVERLPGIIPEAPRTGLLCFRRAPADHPEYLKEVLSPEGDLETAATRLFAALRKLSAEPQVKQILAETFPEEGLGRAINDRLRRAAYRGT